MNKVLKVISMLLGAILGYESINLLGLAEEIKFEFSSVVSNNGVYGLIIGGIIGFICLPIITREIIKFVLKVKNKLKVVPLKDIISGIIGLVIGLLLGVLISISFSVSSIPKFGLVLQIVINSILGYLGWTLAIDKREELFNIIVKSGWKSPKVSEDDVVEELEATYKILDTSAIIDGRIADICQTYFIEGTLVIPEFILEELQHIADSADLLKRNRGRRGLDILNKIQKKLDIPVEIYEQDFNDIDEVDSKLVKLAKILKGKVITNDYNLNKVAELQGVSVLNINELANAVKPVVLPGEEMEVKIIKDGKEQGQGVGYLDDGTMIVVDNGRKHIGDEIEVLVTSILQTAAGRMIFAKPKLPTQQAISGY